MKMSMKKTVKPEATEKSWDPLAAYNEVNRTITNEWPDWKSRRIMRCLLCLHMLKK